MHSLYSEIRAMLDYIRPNSSTHLSFQVVLMLVKWDEITEPLTMPITEPFTKPTTEPTTKPTTKPTTEPTTEH